MALTYKQEKFCQEYLIDLNATQAAIRAGYSESTARQIGSDNLTKVDIQDRITELTRNRNKRVEFDQDDVLRNLLLANQIALGEKPHHIIVTERDEDGATLTTSKELSKTDINAFIKVNDLLMKHLGMFEKDNSQKKTEMNIDLGSLSNEDLLKRAEILNTIAQKEE